MKSLFIIFIFSLSSGCTNFFYQPSRAEYTDPKGRLGIDVQNVFVPSKDGTMLHGWLIKEKKGTPHRGTVVQFHGNSENMTSHFLSMMWVAPQGYSLFTFDYRGYGKSKGKPSPQGVYEDAQAALLMAAELENYREKSVLVYGQSLGGAIALRAVSDFPYQEVIRSVVVEGSFLSYKSMATDALSRFWITWPIQWLGYLLVSDQYSAKKTLGDLSPHPLLVVHGEDDQIVPPDQGEMIFKKASEPKCWWLLPHGAHTNLMNVDKGLYRPPMLQFFEEHTCPEKVKELEGKS